MRIVQTKLSLEVSEVVEDMPRVYIENVPTLDGRYEKRVVKVGDGSIIKLFDKTPIPKRDKDVVCPHFLELKWANGCPFNCAWCYLQGTFRFLKRGKRPYIKDWKTIINHIKALFTYNGKTKPELINAGEICDSLIGEHLNPPASLRLIELFNEQDHHKLLLVTKSDRIENLLKTEPKRTIVSFSVNAYPVAERWEKGAPHPLRRIDAGKVLSEYGYRVRVRLDPIVPVKNWKEYYTKVINDIFKNFKPDRITLGTLRGLWSTINNCKDKSWITYLINGENTNWGLKQSFEVRLKIYKFILDLLDKEYGYRDVGICKETVSIWRALGLDYRKIKCNCLL